MPRIKIIVPCHVLGVDRKVDDIVDDPNPNECQNLVNKKLVRFLTTEEEAAEDEKELAAAQNSEQEAEVVKVTPLESSSSSSSSSATLL